MVVVVVVVKIQAVGAKSSSSSSKITIITITIGIITITGTISRRLSFLNKSGVVALCRPGLSRSSQHSAYDSMGDLLSPSRRDVVDRLRRRVDIYRRHSHGCLQRYDPSFQSLSQQSQRDTILLYRRLLDSKKKNQKKNTTKDLSNGASDQRTSTNVITVSHLKRRKRKEKI